MFLKKKNDSVHSLIMEQIKDVENCFVSFESFVRAICVPEPEFETIRSLSAGIVKAEAVADKSLRRMIDSLSGTEFLPSTREDIISIATNCDHVANKCESFAKMVVYQGFHFPKEYDEALLEILDITHSQFDFLEESISRLFSRFGDLLKDHSILDEIRRYESRIDAIEEKMYEKIYSLDLDFAKRVQMASFVEKICGISDVIENIADKIQIMLVTRKA